MSTGSHIQIRPGLLADAAASALADTFKVLGDLTRVRILDALSHAEVAVCDLAELLGLTQSAVSHQLRLLRNTRLVKSRRDGQHIYYTLDDQHIVKLFEQGLEHVQELSARSASAAASHARHKGRA
jgi:DNA-binding transcriptional ArsR family regulator